MNYDLEEIGAFFLANSMALVYGLVGIIILFVVGLFIGGNLLANFIQTFFNPIILVASLIVSYFVAKHEKLFLPSVLLLAFFVWGYGIYLQLANPAWYCTIPIINWLCNAVSVLPWIFDLLVKGAVFFVQIQIFSFIFKQFGWD